MEPGRRFRVKLLINMDVKEQAQDVFPFGRLFAGDHVAEPRVKNLDFISLNI